MTRIRVAILADFLEEGWPSMDLVADMLFDRLQREHHALVDPTLVRPAMRRRLSGLAGPPPGSLSLDRIANRMWDYPRHVSGIAGRFDLFHVIDHSYSQLVHRLPPARTLVTCHDLDTFRCVLEPDAERRSRAFRAMTRHILSGLRKAGHVTCDSAATRDALVKRVGVPMARTTVVHNGPHPGCSPQPDPSAELEAMRLLGPRASVELLHVGSTIPRKRIDILLRVFAAVRGSYPDARLIRAGGPFTAEQRALARDLGVSERIVVLPILDRATLSAIYRRSAVVLMPSEREGFGLPVLESMACGTPVVASDIPALREVGGQAVSYCTVGDVPGWSAVVLRLLQERHAAPHAWTLRRDTAIRRASAFSWSMYAGEMATTYTRLAGVGVGA
jgi:glycosyltransferase involved in cell wall biosynthesis